MPPIYVINLDRDVERMASLAGSLNGLGDFSGPGAGLDGQVDQRRFERDGT